MKRIIIDTNIWHYSYVIPGEEGYKEIHNCAETFILEKLSNIDVKLILSSYQVGEILEVLRKALVEKDKIIRLADRFKTEKFEIVDVSFKIVSDCHTKSIKSDIHIYDYFVVLPVKDIVEKIYSADDHFQHKDFTSICEVINPLKPWILREGKKPIKQEINKGQDKPRRE